MDEGRLTPDIVEKISASTHVKGAICSTVATSSPLADVLAKHFPGIIRLSAQTPMPLGIRYNSAQTLGADRIAAAVGALAVAPRENALIADIGTAATYDFVDANGIFQGGNIAPGVELRLRSLAEFTSALPLVQADGPVALLGHDTASAMRAGAVLGVVAEIELYHSRLTEINGPASLIITGGGAPLVAPLISLPFIHEPHLVMIGLKRILDYNENN